MCYDPLRFSLRSQICSHPISFLIISFLSWGCPGHAPCAPARVICVFVSLSLCLCVFVSLCLCVFVSLCLCVFVFVCLCVCVRLCLICLFSLLVCPLSLSLVPCPCPCPLSLSSKMSLSLGPRARGPCPWVPGPGDGRGGWASIFLDYWGGSGPRAILAADPENEEGPRSS